jgi:site-specific DNA-methyltransferase (adenine-specific)
LKEKQRAPRNKTIVLSEEEKDRYSRQLIYLPLTPDMDVVNKIVCGDMFEAVKDLPRAVADLLFVDPPYNLYKKFNTNSFHKMGLKSYAEWLESWLILVLPILKPDASVYICGDWQSSQAICQVMSNHLFVHNRITWEREKGRGAMKNWKNASEDIWFGSVGKNYYFNVDAVKLKRRVLAPYRDHKGQPKDWKETREGNYRLTHPSNLWTDITVPFWSMAENTDHPTQKPEKLLAKIILASTRKGDVILDPFMGSGTTAVTAKKLGRNFIGIEKEREYCCLAMKRLEMAESDNTIQGYRDGVFWERNS